MATNLDRETAKIFVLRPKASASAHRALTPEAVETEMRMRRAVAAALGSALYHDAAIDDDVESDLQRH